MQHTPRLQIPYPDLIDVADANLDLANLATAIDSAVIYGQGPLASRPISTAASPGIQARLYLATDQIPPVLYYDTGTSWIPVGQIQDGSVGTNQLADHAVTEIKLAIPAVGTPEIFDLAVTTGKLADLAVTAAKIAAALKPSQGAGAAVEALRAIGPSAGQVVGGDDPRLTLGASLIGSNVGTSFPGAGLFTGYLFTLEVSDPESASWRFWPCIYRPDLDSNYPWHIIGEASPVAVSEPTGINIPSTGHSLIGPTVSAPRAGVYRTTITARATNAGGGSGADNRTYAAIGISGALASGDLSSASTAQYDTAQHNMDGQLYASEVYTIGAGGYASLWARKEGVDQTPQLLVRHISLRPIKMA